MPKKTKKKKVKKLSVSKRLDKTISKAEKGLNEFQRGITKVLGGDQFV